MILPNPSMDFDALDVLTAAELDDLVENDQAIAAGLNDGTALTGIKKDLLTVDSNPYKFRARRTSAQNLTGGADVKINFNTEDFDTNSNYDAATNFRYTAPVAGFYLFNAYVNSAPATLVLSIYKNGSLYQRGSQQGAGGASSTWFVQSSISDYWEIWAFGSTGTAIEITTNLQPHFEGFLVCRT